MSEGSNISHTSIALQRAVTAAQHILSADDAPEHQPSGPSLDPPLLPRTLPQIDSQKIPSRPHPANE